MVPFMPFIMHRRRTLKRGRHSVVEFNLLENPQQHFVPTPLRRVAVFCLALLATAAVAALVLALEALWF